MPALVAPRMPDVLGAWHVEPPVVAALVVAVLAYRSAVRARSRHGARAVPVGGPRQWAFYTGMATVAVALLSPLATYAEALLSVHMVQHLVLTLVAAPLIVLGRPLTVLSGGRDLRLGALAPVARVAGHPLVAWVAFAATGWAVHFSSLFELALRSPLAHAVEHALFLGTALLFWAPVVGSGLGSRPPMAHPLRLLYLAVAMPQNTFLALAIFSSGDVLYRGYEGVVRDWGPSPLSDQRTAGGLMWVAGDLLLLVSVLLVANAWANHEARQNAAAEAEADADADARASGEVGRGPWPRTAG